jgi:hypothetical protein
MEEIRFLFHGARVIRVSESNPRPKMRRSFGAKDAPQDDKKIGLDFGAGI